MTFSLLLIAQFLINPLLITSLSSKVLHQIGNRKFWHILDPYSYADAKDACLEHGAELAVFRNVQELNYFKDGSISGWIGMTCPNGHYAWSDGRSVTFGDWINGDTCTGDNGVIFNGDKFLSIDDTTFYAICSEIRSYESEILLPAIQKTSFGQDTNNKEEESRIETPPVDKDCEGIGLNLTRKVNEISDSFESHAQESGYLDQISKEMNIIDQRLSAIESRAKKVFHISLITITLTILIVIALGIIVMALHKSGQIGVSKLSEHELKRKSGINP